MAAKNITFKKTELHQHMHLLPMPEEIANPQKI